MSAPSRTELPVRGSYRVAPAQSTATFHARGLFGLPVRGRLPIRSGTVRIEDGRARVCAELDPAGLETGIARRDDHLRSPQLLDVAQYPAIRFDGELVGEPDHVRGTLTVHGETVPTTLDVREIRRDGDRVEVVATTRVDRHTFGVTALRAIIQRHIVVELTVALVPGE